MFDTNPIKPVECDISIVILNWNTKNLTLDCIQSIMSNTSHDYSEEIIVVDNGSTDGSQYAISKQYPGIFLIRNEINLGFAKGNNVAMRRAVGRYICLINSDVLVLNGCIDRMYSYMDTHPDVGMIGPRILNPDLTLQPSCRKFPSLLNSLGRALALDVIFPSIAFFCHDKTRSVDVISGCFLMVRREAINKIGYLDENLFIYAEDKDWCKRFKEAGWNVVYYPESQAVHHGGASSANVPTEAMIEMHKANLYYWKKHHRDLASKIVLGIMFLNQIVRIMRNSLCYFLRSCNKEMYLRRLKANISCVRWLINFRWSGSGPLAKI